MKALLKSCVLATLLVVSIYCFTACGSNKDAIVFTEKVNDQYASVVWNDKEYVPFSAVLSSEDMGNYLGYMENEVEMKVYGYKDYSNEEWIITSGYGCAMLYRETNVQNIPNGLVSEYDWNN